ncbi:MAG: hypothetical protein ACRBM6_38195 [Geminicoccales bacterium]
MAKTKCSWKDLKPVVEEFPAKDLLGLVQDLYRFSADNRDFLHTRFLSRGRPSQEDLKPYKRRIRLALCPDDPWKHAVKLSAGRKVIRDFKKAHGDLGATLELMLHYVRCGNDFTLQFGDVDTSFYQSMMSMFGDIVTTLNQQRDPALVREFVPKMTAEIKRVEGAVGWGYADALRDWIAELADEPSTDGLLQTDYP